MTENPITNLVLACLIAVVLLFLALVFFAISRRYSRYVQKSDGYGNTWSELVDRGPVGTCASCLGSFVAILLTLAILAIVGYALVAVGSFVTANWSSITGVLSVAGVLLAGLAVLAIAAVVIWGIVKFATAFIHDLSHPGRYD
jgi:hypothetical protein